jgi:cytochrome c oxidase subunit 2
VISVATIASVIPPHILGGHGDEGHRIGQLWWLMFGLAAAVYVIVAAFVILAVLRGRRRDRVEHPDLSPARSDAGFIWVGGVIVPVLILSLLGVVTVTTTAGLRNPKPDAVQIHVTGERWWWDVDYTDAHIRTANEVRVPVGQPVDLTLTSDNVIHSFWVPDLAGKVDMIPGQTNHLRFTAKKAGTYRGQCAEFCGLAHAQMAFVVIAQSPTDFGRWLARRTSGAGTQAESDPAAQGQRLFDAQSCSGCHTIAGTTADGRVGPDLSDFGERLSIAALTVPNTRADLRRWITDPQSIKPGNLMPPTQLTPQELDEIVAYLESLR